MQELWANMTYLSKYSREFLAIMENILTRFHDRCIAKYTECLENTEVIKRVKTPEVLQLLAADPLWKALSSINAQKFNMETGSSISGNSNVPFYILIFFLLFSQ